MTAAARSAREPGSRTSSGCWIWTAGQPGCASSCGRNGPIPGRSCGSPTLTGTGSPLSPPTPGKASSLTWSCGTAGGRGARTRTAKDTGLRNLPLKGFAQNQVWCEIVALACELLAWTQMLALTGIARRWEPKRLRPARVRRRRAPRAQRQAPAAPPRRTLVLGRTDHGRGHPPAGPPVRLTSQNSYRDQEGETPAPVEPRPPGTTAGQSRTAGH